MTDAYRDFLERKVCVADSFGFEVDCTHLNAGLSPHARAIVPWLCRGGRRALFASFGLQKTVMQLEAVRLCAEHAGGPGLITLPLGVRQEFRRDAVERLGWRDPPPFIRSADNLEAGRVYLTNYETVRDGKLDPKHFVASSLDEADVLRGFGGSKTFREFMALFAGDRKTMDDRVITDGVKYRFVATATPSPNDHIELLAYAAYLGIMDVSAAKTRFFKRNSEKADELTIHPHKAAEFWMWVSSWALIVTKPSDILCTWKDTGSKARNSGNSRSSVGTAESGTAHASVADHADQIPTDCSEGATSVAAACGHATAAKERALTESGAECSTAADGEHIRTGATTVAAESRSAADGSHTRTSSPTWDSHRPEQHSNVETTTATTSPGTASGPVEKLRPETRDVQSASPTPEKHSLLPHGQRNSAPTTGSCTHAINSAGRRKECSPACAEGNCPWDEGYVLPDLDLRWHEIPTDHDGAGHEKDGQARMFRNAAVGVSDAAREKRRSLDDRIAKMLEIRAEEPDEHRIIWHDLEDERRAIEAAVPGVRSVYGSQDLDEREQTIIDFSDGKFAELAAKPTIAGAGCNFQRHCARAIFLGIGFKFRDLLQALHRIQRFLQTRTVRIDLIYTEAERDVRRILEEKWADHVELQKQLTAIVREYGLANASAASELTRALGVKRVEASGPGWRAVNNDCVLELPSMESNSVGLVLTSIPFSTQYEYSPNYCYDEQTEVLTKRGWLSFGELTVDDQVATMRLESRAIEWQAPQRIVWEPYAGPMLAFRNRANFDLVVTPNHKLIVDERIGNHLSGRKTKRFRGIQASKVADAFVARKWRMLNAAAPGLGDEPESIEVPRIPDGARGPKRKRVSRMKPEDFAELAGWYLSEGHCDSLSSRHAGRISLCQCAVNQRHRDEIAALLLRIGLRPSLQERAIVAHNKDIAAFLLENFGAGSHSKRIPRWVKDLHPRLLKILRDTMMKGDGTKTGFAYTSFSARLCDDFQEICLLTGWRATIRGRDVGIGRKQLFPEIRVAPERITYDGMIGCATVPNGTLVVRRNGVMCISGNSDFGHTDNNAHFFAQMDFLTPELLRVLQPGRIAAIHVKDRVVPGGLKGLGFQTVYPFSDKTREHFERHGFEFICRKTIVTDVVRENNQTYRLGWTEQCKDATKMGAGLPEYLLYLRKPPTDASRSYADVPVVKDKAKYSRARWQFDAHGFARSSGNRRLEPEELEGLEQQAVFKLFREHSLTQVYDFEHDVRIGEFVDVRGWLPSTFMLLQPQSWHDDVWTDVTRMRTLNGMQHAKGREMHLCPMQFDIADRVIAQLSNPGDVVLDPFAGLMTVVERSIRLGRHGVGIELATNYFLDGITYCKAAEREMAMPSLFDILEKSA